LDSLKRLVKVFLFSFFALEKRSCSGLPDGFQTKNPNLGTFWRAGIFYGHLEYFTVIWYIVWPFGNVVVIWYSFTRFGTLCQEKSGNPDLVVLSYQQQSLSTIF
jgi:hypothetical protein